MNRKIVFRGKDLQTKEWRHGYLYRLKLPSGFANMILVGDDVEIEMDNSSSPRHHLSFTLEKDLYAVSSDTIGQFTGLQDSNGNDIYEGDIIYCEFGDGSNIKMLIGWNENEACFGLMDEYKYCSKLKVYAFPKFDNDVLFNFRDAERFEIVGNVVDNPELLKGGEKWIKD